MVIKIYISGISGNKEVKKRQQRVLLILDSKNIKYEVVDIAEPGNEEIKDFMQNNSTSSGGTISDPNPRHALPPQIFNDDQYCGDYDQFDMSNEIDEMEKFLKLAPSESEPTVTSNAELKMGNGEVTHDNNTEEVETKEEVKEQEVAEVNEETSENIESKTENDNEQETKTQEENEENADEE